MNRNLLVRSQSIATRVAGDPESGNNGLFYIHSDHLGSATFLTHGNGHGSEGYKVANSTKFFTPFGEYRIQPSYPTSEITDRGFTGHKQNDEIGLIYMNARYYLGAVGRFASADTIIPNPGNPQTHNRFSYVNNNAVNLVDPSGHCAGGTTNNPFNDAGEIIYFDCTFDDFESMSMQDRLRWIQQLMSQGVNGRAENWFNNIGGIIQSYLDFDLADSGSWLSTVNAGILQGIQDGYALWNGAAYYSSLNPGAELWNNFFTELAGARDDTKLLQLWGTAEAASTSFGVGMATQRNILPNLTEAWFLGISEVYRQANAGLGGNLSIVGEFGGAVIDGITGTENGQMTLGLAVDQFADPRTMWGPNNDTAPVQYFTSYFVWGPQAVFQNAWAAWFGPAE